MSKRKNPNRAKIRAKRENKARKFKERIAMEHSKVLKPGLFDVLVDWHRGRPRGDR